eukprot:TRINITY_DN1399_c0_g1_i2.p1 TRINITY_DN1399_c0_g1~~TRINITY_DN1399_c0_g1_i2.p1  ORF type:complete len:160 (+),score=33.72 TRINITY_DN1399_c0_g1_i2:98-577(+)
MKGVFAVVFLAFVCLGSCHLCSLFPPQRGGAVGLNKAASPSCIKIDGPCGDNTVERPTLEFIGGQKYNFTFQKNANHWNATDPGYFGVDYSKMTSGPLHFESLAKIPDENTADLTLYTVEVTIPVREDPHAVIRFSYVSNHSGEPIFYQCSDVKVGSRF